MFGTFRSSDFSVFFGTCRLGEIPSWQKYVEDELKNEIESWVFLNSASRGTGGNYFDLSLKLSELESTDLFVCSIKDPTDFLIPELSLEVGFALARRIPIIIFFEENRVAALNSINPLIMSHCKHFCFSLPELVNTITMLRENQDLDILKSTLEDLSNVIEQE